MYEAGFDKKDLTQLIAALKLEADGPGLTRDLRIALKAAAEPAAAAARASILEAQFPGLPPGKRPRKREQDPGLRASIAAGIRVEAALGAKSSRVNIAAHSRQMPRGFRKGVYLTNALKGFWRHPVFSPIHPGFRKDPRFIANAKTTKETWVSQEGSPRWFSRPILAEREGVIRAVGECLDAVARRISERTKG